MLETLFKKMGVEFKRNEIIFCEYELSTDCYFVLSGEVRIVKLLGNRQKTLDIIGNGSFFGEMAILEAEPRSASAIAIDSVKTLKFNRENFDLMMKLQPQLALNLLIIFANRIYDAKRRMQTLLLDSPKVRVSDVFIVFSEKDPGYGKVKEMTFRTNVADVASWCNLPEEQVREILIGFSRANKIQLYKNQIVVKNINDFQRLVTYHRKNLMLNN